MQPSRSPASTSPTLGKRPGPQQQESLPSIRQLHPYLPPAGMSQHTPGSGEASHQPTYAFQPPFQMSQHEAQLPSTSSQPESQQMDSEVEESDHQGPVKKKRRRQALSCTGSYC